MAFYILKTDKNAPKIPEKKSFLIFVSNKLWQDYTFYVKSCKRALKYQVSKSHLSTLCPTKFIGIYTSPIVSLTILLFKRACENM